MLRDEFMLNLSKFVQQIKRTINQIEGRFGLEIPESVQAIQKEPVAELAKNAEIVEMLENTVSNWQNQVQLLVKKIFRKFFWKSRKISTFFFTF